MAGLPMTLTAVATGEPWGSLTIGPLVDTGTIVPIVLGPSIASGNNTITIPTGGSGMLFIPPATNTQALLYKVVSGDTGTPMPLASWFVVNFNQAAPPASVIVNAAGSVGICQIVLW